MNANLGRTVSSFLTPLRMPKSQAEWGKKPPSCQAWTIWGPKEMTAAAENPQDECSLACQKTAVVSPRAGM